MTMAKGRLLDLGTGPATQAIELSKLGFQVTATDISENAIARAKSMSKDIEFIVDDILESKLKDDSLTTYSTVDAFMCWSLHLGRDMSIK
jgi:ubiquinone/menaquinone biosynthesis C-methylase UbiE